MIKSIISNRRLTKIVYLLILTFTFLKIYSSIFDKKVSMVGDNANYYILGNAIANGEGYMNIQHLEKEAHYHYPPGYPALIACVIKLFSNDIVNIKILNGVFLFGAILLLFFIIKNLTQNYHIAFASCFITLLNYHILVYSTSMMSEIPFLFFSMLCLWLFINLNLSKPVLKNPLFFALLICLSFSFYIKSVALALFASLVLFFILKKLWHYLYSLILGFIILYIPWVIRNRHSTGVTYLNQLSLKNPYQPELGKMSFPDMWERILLNAERYITKEIPSGIISYKEIIYTEALVPVNEWLVGLLIFACIAFGICKLSRFRILILFYVFAFFSLLVLWPNVWYGTRFLLPLIPLLIFLFIFGIIEMLKWLSAKTFPKYKKYLTPILITLTLSFWAFSYGSKSIPKLQNMAKEAYTKEYQNYFTLANWINKNTSENSVTCVRKEALFYLFSHKHVSSYQKTLDREAQIEYLKSKNVDYVVVEQLGYSSTYKYLLPTIDRYPLKFKIIKELKNPNTYLMQFLPELGYWGAWENEKRNGLGSYKWEDGQKYEGYWKNDLRHGKGTVYLKNGENISGVWENGKLNGEVIKKSTNGKIIEISLYENNKKLKVIK